MLTNLFTYLLTYLRTYLLSYLLTYLPTTYLLIYFLTLLTYLLSYFTYLLTYLHTHFITYLLTLSLFIRLELKATTISGCPLCLIATTDAASTPKSPSSCWIATLEVQWHLLEQGSYDSQKMTFTYARSVISAQLVGRVVQCRKEAGTEGKVTGLRMKGLPSLSQLTAVLFELTKSWLRDSLRILVRLSRALGHRVSMNEPQWSRTRENTAAIWTKFVRHENVFRSRRADSGNMLSTEWTSNISCIHLIQWNASPCEN